MAGVSGILTTIQNGVVAVNQLDQFIVNATTTNLAGQSALRVSGIRTLLTAPLTVYVRTDGSDSNNGLTNTASGAFATIAGAYNSLATKYDTGGFTVTIQGTTGVNTFTTPASLTRALVGGGQLVIDLGTGGSLTTATTSGLSFNFNIPAMITLNNIKFASSGDSVLLGAGGGGTVALGSNIEFGTAGVNGYQMQIAAGAVLRCQTNYAISGGAAIHAYATMGGVIDLYAGASGTTTTVTADITYSQAFVFCDPGGNLQCIAGTRAFVLGGHVVTGSRYTVAGGGVINTQGGGAAYFPGTLAGTGAGTYV